MSFHKIATVEGGLVTTIIITLTMIAVAVVKLMVITSHCQTWISIIMLTRTVVRMTTVRVRIVISSIHRPVWRVMRRKIIIVISRRIRRWAGILRVCSIISDIGYYDVSCIKMVGINCLVKNLLKKKINCTLKHGV